MKRHLTVALCLAVLASTAHAENPIVSHVYTADPTARVFNDRVYVYASHDADDAQGFWKLLDYHVFSSDDMVNWQDHGVVLSADDMPWVKALYAPDCVFRNGKYYLYFPNEMKGIGVAVSDNPFGPFKDAIGHALIDKKTPGAEGVKWLFDPSVLIDDGGQAYLYFGGGKSKTSNLRVVKLKENMLELDGPAVTLDLPEPYEGLFAHKRDGKYYLSYPHKKGNDIAYHMSDRPMDGWTYKGVILSNPPGNANGNSHGSIVEYKGQWYMFYHTRKVSLDRGDDNAKFKRSMSVDFLSYKDDGTIREVVPTWAGAKQLKPVDGFAKNEAETFSREERIETEPCGEGGIDVTDIQDGDWIKISGVEFGAGAKSFDARVASETGGGRIELRLDRADGPLAGTCDIPATGGMQKWKTVSCEVTGATHRHDLYLKFSGTGKSLFNFDWWKFES